MTHSYTVCAWGEAVSMTEVALNQQDLPVLLRIFDAVNQTAIGNNNGSALLFLFDGTRSMDDLVAGTVQPINDRYWGAADA